MEAVVIGALLVLAVGVSTVVGACVFVSLFTIGTRVARWYRRTYDAS